MRRRGSSGTGGTNATVVSQGQKHFVNGLSAGLHSFFERIPGKAGDILGARFDTSPFIDATPHIFATASASDEAGYLSTPADPEPGDPFTASPIANRRVNVSAVFEPDEDGDGYGDTSQDLCPGSEVATTACTGTLLGSSLQGAFLTVGHNCTYACLRVQATVDGASTAAPVNGVVVRWRLLAAPSGNYRIRVLGPTGASTYSVLRSSSAESVVAPASFAAITTFDARLPIPAGGYVALVPPIFTIQSFRETAPESTYRQVNDGADGSSVDFAGYGPPLAGEALYDADVEPDADADGFGDVTQDACPAQGSTQGECAPGPRPAVPAIRNFRAAPKRFRVAPRGAVISAERAHPGTTLQLSLSEAARVAFTVERRIDCSKAQKPKRCAPWKRVHSFARDLAAGAASVRYSGRFRQGPKRGTLSPGAHRVAAIATSRAGVSSAIARAPITVVR